VSTFKVSEVIDAIEKNGYPKIKDVFIQKNPRVNILGFKYGSKITGACAIGQAALNLGVFYEDLYRGLNKIQKGFHGSLKGRIVELNDYTEMTIPEIAQQVREEFKDYLDAKIDV